MSGSGQSADPNYRYSINRFDGDGEKINWEISFAGGYIIKEHVKALVTDLAGNSNEQLFTWAGDSTVQITPPVPEGYSLTIFRETPKDRPIADFQDGAVINEKNLDDNAKQAVFIAAEALDRGEGALGELAPRAILVPVGEIAPGFPPRDRVRGKILGVDLAGKIVGIGLNGDNQFIPTTGMIDFDGTNLADVLRSRIAQLELTAEELRDATLKITEQGEELVEQAISTANIDTRLTQLKTDHESLTAVVDALTDLGNPDGIATLIQRERSERIDGDTALAATIAVIGAKSSDNSAFILNLENVKVSPEESLAERLEYLDAEDAENTALIEDERIARIAADEAEASARLSLGAEVRSEFAAALLVEQTARADADSAEASSRTSLAATLRQETATGLSGEAATRSAQITAAINQEASTRATADAAEATARQQLATTLRGETNALITQEQQARSDAISAEAHNRELLGATIRTEVSAQIQAEANIRATNDLVFANTIALLGARNSNGSAFILNENTTLLQGGVSIGTRLSGIDTAVANANALIAAETQARSSAVAAEAQQRTALQASLNTALVRLDRRDVASDFVDRGKYFSGSSYSGKDLPEIPDTGSAITFTTVAGIGTVCNLPSGGYYVAQRGAIKVLPNRRYRLTVLVRNPGSTDPASFYMEILGLDASLLYTGSVASKGITASVASGWQTVSVELNTGPVPSYSYIRGYFYSTHAAQIAALRLEDITSEATLSAAISTEEAARVAADSAEASARQTLAASLRSESSWAQQKNRSFDYGLDGWAPNLDGTGTFPAGVTTVSSWDGGMYLYVPPGAATYVFSKRLYPVDTSRKYRFRANIGAYRNGASGQTGQYFAGFVGYDANGNMLDHGGYGSYRYCIQEPGDNTVQWSLPDGQRKEGESIVTGEGNDSWFKFPPGTKQVRLVTIMNYTGTGADIGGYLGWLDIEDVTVAENLQAAITSEQSARVTADTALAGRATTLEATVNSSTDGNAALKARITTEESARVTLEGKFNLTYSLTLNANGFITGVKFNNNGSTGTAAFDVDNFYVGRGGVTSQRPFEIVGSTVYVAGTAFRDGSITAQKLNVSSLSAITATIGVLRTATSGARMEIRDNVIKSFDINGVLRVQLGDLSL